MSCARWGFGFAFFPKAAKSDWQNQQKESTHNHQPGDTHCAHARVVVLSTYTLSERVNIVTITFCAVKHISPRTTAYRSLTNAFIVVSAGWVDEIVVDVSSGALLLLAHL